MRIIDLLNKIAKGEEAPKEIYYKKQWWEYNPENDYEGTDWGGCLLNNVLICDLNDEIVIIEEEQDIEELKLKDGKIVGTWENGSNYCYTLSAPQTVLCNKINEVIKEVNKQKNNEEVL